MKKTVHIGMAVSTLLFLVLTVSSCATGTYLRTTETKPDEISGSYRLILYGGRYSDDIENVAILDREGDPFTFEFYAPAFDYTEMKGLGGREAIARAEKHVSRHHSFRHSLVSRILDTKGETIGYEVRPIYSPLDFGFSDALEVDYLLHDGTITVRIGLRTEIERRRFDRKRLFFPD